VASPIDRASLDAFLESHRGWTQDGEALARTWKFRTFVEAMAFVREVADLAEAVGHHPDIHVHYDEVTLRIWTHSTGTLTERDLDLAARTDALA
jgi:4a-hydroxytetrahydrobiopterin dehydratase